MIERVIRDGIPCLVGYHTQEFREADQPLTFPIMCHSYQAWLGFGYYFWLEEDHSHSWGKTSKNRTGMYDVYKGAIKEMGLLNTTFSEDAYFFFRETIDKVIRNFKNDNLPINVHTVHRYLVDKYWPIAGITGIIYDDLPQTYSLIKPLYYKKRIQLVVFDLKNIITFDISSEANVC